MRRSRTAVLKTARVNAMITPRVKARLGRIAETWEVSEAEALARAIDRAWEKVAEEVAEEETRV